MIKKDKILIRNVWESKKYGTRRLTNKFPNKNWNRPGWLGRLCADYEQLAQLNAHPAADDLDHTVRTAETDFAR